MHPMGDVLHDAMLGMTEGRCCHYVADNSRHLAAIVIGYDASQSSSRADLAVFMNMQNGAGKKTFGLQFHELVEYSENKEPGTWHWIERG